MTDRAQILHTLDGETLEAIWSDPDVAAMAAVFCHPHPLQGGTMNAPLMEAVTAELVDAGIAVLRFNFRGVGRSTGLHGGGVAEHADIDAAMEAARGRHPDLPFGLAGWSFGAATSLGWLATRPERLSWVGIAPPVASDRTPPLPPPDRLPPGTRTLVLGDRDQFTPVEDLAAYAAGIGARLHVLAGSDHFFYFRESQVGRLVAGGLLGEAPSDEAPSDVEVE